MHATVIIEEQNSIGECVGHVQVSDGVLPGSVRITLGADNQIYVNVDELHAAVASVMHVHSLNHPDYEGDN